MKYICLVMFLIHLPGMVFAGEPAGLTQELNGRTYEYTYESGMRARIWFDAEQVSYEVLAGPTRGNTNTIDYKARKVAEDIYLVQWYQASNGNTVSLVINERDQVLYGSSILEVQGLMFESAVIDKME
jgi:phenolic acid decarboxylase